MYEGSVYVVDLEEPVRQLERDLSNHEMLELPTIDLDPLKWQVLEMFLAEEPIAKLEFLDKIASHMAQGDMLFDKEEFFESTPWQRREAEQRMRKYIKTSIARFGQNCFIKLQHVGLIITGSERYAVKHQPLTNEIYLFTRLRNEVS